MKQYFRTLWNTLRGRNPNYLIGWRLRLCWMVLRGDTEYELVPTGRYYELSDARTWRHGHADERIPLGALAQRNRRKAPPP